MKFGSRASSCATVACGGRRDGSNNPSGGERSNDKRSPPFSTSAATPLNTLSHLPQRTVPECAASWSRRTEQCRTPGSV
jgi:hypothetical protein